MKEIIKNEEELAVRKDLRNAAICRSNNVDAVKVSKVAHLFSLDVAPIVHGNWCWYPDERDRQELYCSECEQPALYNEDRIQAPTAYCPWCGANMTQKQF